VSPTDVPRIVLAAVAAGTVTAVLAGCSGGGNPASGETVTVTATTEPTASATTDVPEGGDVDGRKHDVGTIVDVAEVGGQQVLTLDRWTLVGVDDAALSRVGAPVQPYSGERFTNQNTERTYTVPVAAGSVLVVNECRPPATPGAAPGLTSRRGDLADFLTGPDVGSAVVLLTYDDGELVQLDTDPRC
jgi:hypothetical protein